MMKARIRFGDRASGFIETTKKATSGIKLGGMFDVWAFRRGKFLWHDTARNLVVDVGIQHILDAIFSGATQVDPWYVGLTDGTPTVAAGDTLASHAGWTEISDYDEAARQAYVETRTGQSMSNASSKAVFTINASVTVGGLFLCSVATTTTGTLLCAAAFTGGDKSLADDDVLNAQYVFTGADDGA